MYAKSPEHYIRAFLLLLKDVQELFDYIEPADANLPCFSYRIHALLMRTCIEVEANCRAILSENRYDKVGWWNMEDYKKIDKSHRLSSYRVRFPLWDGERGDRMPYSSWDSNGKLQWYDAYNKTKHDRLESFGAANFEHLTDAICGLVAVLAAQFHTEDFAIVDHIICDGPTEFEAVVGDYFQVKFPTDWPDADRYDFDWQALMQESDDPFQNFDYGS